MSKSILIVRGGHWSHTELNSVSLKLLSVAQFRLRWRRLVNVNISFRSNYCSIITETLLYWLFR